MIRNEREVDFLNIIDIAQSVWQQVPLQDSDQQRLITYIDQTYTHYFGNIPAKNASHIEPGSQGIIHLTRHTFTENLDATTDYPTVTLDALTQSWEGNRWVVELVRCRSSSFTGLTRIAVSNLGTSVELNLLQA